MSKLPHIGSSIFSVMSKMALDHGAINLSQGFPNFPIDERLSEILQKTASGNFHQYAPMAGNSHLLEQLAALCFKQYKRKVQAQDHILVTAGATQAIFTSIQALVYAGDEVVVLDPAYDCYDPAILLCQAKPVHVNLNLDFTPNWDRIREAITARTVMLIVNNPHNPSGVCWQKSDLEALEQLLLDFPKLTLLSDEVYEYIYFGKKHFSVHESEILQERSIVVSSFGKTFHITGWKMGYIIAPPSLLVEIKKVHQFVVFSVNSLAQEALALYLEDVDIHELGFFYNSKRLFFQNQIQASRFEILPCQGTYFQILSYAGISEESDTDFVQTLVKKHGLSTIPISPFYQDGSDHKLIRLCFAKDDDTLTKAAEILCKI